MNDNVIFDTNATSDLIDAIKCVINEIDISVKDDFNSKSNLFKSLDILFASSMNVISSQIDNVEEQLYNASIILAKHKIESEKVFSDIQKYISSINMIGNNTVKDAIVDSIYSEVKLNDIVYSKDINNSLSNLETTESTADDIEIINVKEENLENINNQNEPIYVEGDNDETYNG